MHHQSPRSNTQASAEPSISGLRVARELDALVRGSRTPQLIIWPPASVYSQGFK